MALDVGDRTIGVALSDGLGITAQGLKTIKRKSLQEDLEELKNIIDGNQVKKLIVGMPKNMDGSMGKQADKIVGFVNFIKKRIAIDIEYWDERLTSKFAEGMMIEGDLKRKERKEKIDKMAAQAILQNYMDSK
ncbi:MAG TPA: Holliday junction resolvase RuvX [Eubacteriaceae bacterium]|nr:Holliday junction resolvase RuvX [Eubacteriaceae bacterium]